MTPACPCAPRLRPRRNRRRHARPELDAGARHRLDDAPPEVGGHRILPLRSDDDRELKARPEVPELDDAVDGGLGLLVGGLGGPRPPRVPKRLERGPRILRVRDRYLDDGDRVIAAEIPDPGDGAVGDGEQFSGVLADLGDPDRYPLDGPDVAVDPHDV